MPNVTLFLALALLWRPDALPTPVECPVPPEYYKIDLVPTRRVPVARIATGTAHLTFKESPFGIAVTARGHYVYEVEVVVENLRPSPKGHYTAWLAMPDLQTFTRLGPLDGYVRGETHWNKFIVFVTLEPDLSANPQDRWRGPVVMRGLSRSGLMHTMAGHGPYEQEPCAVYGYY